MFSDDRAAELREFFFETATELLQTLNDKGMELEKRPEDQEVLREVRRCVHTLKGDSAACGYTELSGLAHQLEEVLRPEVAAASKQALAEVVLIAADTFSSMLSAHRGNLQLPAGEELKQQIISLTRKPAANVRYKLQARFYWSEYEQLAINEALGRGETVFHVAFSIDPACPMRSAAMQLVRNVLQDCGRMLAIVPDKTTLSNDLDVIEAAISTSHKRAWIERKCRIPSVVSDLLLEPVEPAGHQQSEDVLDIVEHLKAPEEEALPSLGIPEAAPSAQENESAPAETAAASTLSSLPETLLRVDAERIDSVLNLVGELIIAKGMLHQAVAEFDRRFPKDPLRTRLADAIAFQARTMNDLQKSVMKIRMVPVEHLFRRFPRVVRDVAKACGKEITLQMTGQETDLDKSILDMLAEPIAHLVRNAIGHGIEPPSERAAQGKPGQGTVRLDAYHQGNQIVIEVTDDGRGIDREKLKAKAIERKIISASDAAALSDHETLELVFHPGLSTAEEITAISGRGVGMDVVRSVMDRLKGHVSIKSTPDKGTTFHLKVPLTLAIIKALLFKAGDQLYAVPVSSVVEITRTSLSDVHTIDKHDVVQLRNEVLTLLHLRHLVNEPARSSKMFVVVISLGERKFGLVVDQLVGEEELVIKALDDHLVATDLVSGASILGDGRVVLILNLASLVAKLGHIQMMGATA